MKKVLALLLAVSMLLASAGCGKKDMTKGLTYDGEKFWVNEDPKYSGVIECAQRLCLDYDTPMNVMIATDNEVIFAAGMLTYEIDSELRVNPYTVYEIGSMTKTFTAVAIMQLIEQGKLTMDDTLDRFWPGYEDAEDITVSDLLHMTSGLADYQTGFMYGDYSEANCSFYYHDGNITDEEAVDAILSYGHIVPPGMMYQYCNTNYYLLGLIIEQLTGETYQQYINDHIFKPCGMEHSSSCTHRDLTCAPVLTDRQWREAENYTDEGFMDCVVFCRGCGDIHSCTADLVAFDRALMGGKLVSEESLALMTDFDNPGEYGCGLYAGNGYLGHSGGTMSYNSMNGIIDTSGFGRVYVICLEPTIPTDHDLVAPCYVDDLAAEAFGVTG